MIRFRMPFHLAFKLVDAGFARLELAGLHENPLEGLEASKDLDRRFRLSGWTESEFNEELLRHIDQDWDPHPPSGGKKEMPILHIPDMRLAA